MKKKIKTMDIILFVDFVVLAIFSVVMIWLYFKTGGIPDTLCTCVFGAGGGEFGAMAWIRTTKDRLTDRKNELEDRNHAEMMERKRSDE